MGDSLFCGTSREEPVPRKDSLVREFRAVQFDLNVLAVDHGISGEEEGNRILNPLFSGEGFRDDLLEHLALVPLLIEEQVRGADQQSLRKKSLEIRGSRLDADLAETAFRGARAIVLEVGGEFLEGHSGHRVEQTGEDETEVVNVARGVLVVGGGQFVRHGGDPLSYLVLTLLIILIGAGLSTTFLPIFHFF